MHPSVARTANVSGKKIGTRLTLERSRDVIRECSRTTFISPPLLLQHVVTASGSNAYVINLSVPCRKSMCFGNVPLQNRAWNTPIFIIDTFPYKIVKKKKKKRTRIRQIVRAKSHIFLTHTHHSPIIYFSNLEVRFSLASISYILTTN